MRERCPDITQLADWFLSKESMTPKKLQKLCYYAVAWGYALLNRRIFNDDEFHAQIHGPVSPTLYHTYGEKWERTRSAFTYRETLAKSTWQMHGI